MCSLAITKEPALALDLALINELSIFDAISHEQTQELLSALPNKTLRVGPC